MEKIQEKKLPNILPVLFFLWAPFCHERGEDSIFDSHSDFACAKSCPSNEIKHLLVKEGMKKISFVHGIAARMSAP